MFRCNTDIKGIVIDADSFKVNFSAWGNLLPKYRIGFITSCDYIKTQIINSYGKNSLISISKGYKNFVPNLITYIDALKKMKDIKASEVVYISADGSFLKNALKFLSGTIGIQLHKITYAEASHLPDFVASEDEIIKGLIKNPSNLGWYGEQLLAGNKKGYLLRVYMPFNDEVIQIITLGRYFPSDHYMNQLHPYSTAIYSNKRNGSKVYGSYTSLFSNIFLSTIKILLKDNLKFDCICSVPSRPGENNRFEAIIQKIHSDTQIADISKSFICNRNYEKQKTLDGEERKRNIKDVFGYNGDLTHKNVVIIDDIITTGATIQECIRVLKEHGANTVSVIVLAINQLAESYWSNNPPVVACPKCDAKMILRINSHSKQFFYSCPCCENTISFQIGQKDLITRVNSKFQVTDNSSDKMNMDF